ncbi:metallophosphoesterase, partial [Candidatus Pacearchaeota archaeon]|nr:metallophosphoesterase [Candidatus Pacearchaeota archaeon]
MILERTIPNYLTRILYTLSAVWLGILFISLWVMIINNLINLFVDIPVFVQKLYVIGLISVVSLYALYNASMTRVKRISIHLKKLKRPVRLVQLTDLHIGTIRSSKFLARIVSKVNSLKPDLVVITGDLFDGSAPLTKEIIAPINSLEAPAYFTIGNHEIYDGIGEVSKILKSTKLKVLRNDKSSFKDIQIVGVDYSDSKGYLGEILPKISIDKNKPSILLYHPPASLDYIE